MIVHLFHNPSTFPFLINRVGSYGLIPYSTLPPSGHRIPFLLLPSSSIPPRRRPPFHHTPDSLYSSHSHLLRHSSLLIKHSSYSPPSRGIHISAPVQEYYEAFRRRVDARFLEQDLVNWRAINPITRSSLIHYTRDKVQGVAQGAWDDLKSGIGKGALRRWQSFCEDETWSKITTRMTSSAPDQRLAMIDKFLKVRHHLAHMRTNREIAKTNLLGRDLLGSEVLGREMELYIQKGEFELLSDFYLYSFGHLERDAGQFPVVLAPNHPTDEESDQSDFLEKLKTGFSYRPPPPEF